MSDLQIVAGGAVAVDTEALRAVAVRLERVGRVLDAAVADLSAAVGILGGSPVSLGTFETSLLPSQSAQCAGAATRADDLGRAARACADAYEIVELRAAAAFATLAGDEATLAAIEGRLAAMRLTIPHAFAQADDAEAAWRGSRSRELAAQAFRGAAPLSFAGAAVLWALAAGLPRMTADSGLVAPERALAGSAAGGVRRLPLPSTPTAAPRGIADLAARIPSGSEARVRVEKYAMPDGAPRFVVYVTGTRGFGDQWGAASNLRLYGGDASPSWAATRAALDAAGATEGDRVVAAGHSQGAMIVSALAESTGYDVEACITFGNPVDVAAGPDTMNVQVRHDDDPVSALAAGGHIAPSGADGSFVATRTADPRAGLHDLGLPAHALTAYEQTGRMLDASADPRLSGIRSLLGGLGAAPPPEVFEYAEAISSSGGDGG